MTQMEKRLVVTRFKDRYGPVGAWFLVMRPVAKNVSSPTWEPLETLTLLSEGQITLEKRRPIVIHSELGTEGIQFGWSQATAALSAISIGLKISDED